MKNVAFSIHKGLSKRVDTLTVTRYGNDVSGTGIKEIRMDRLFLSRKLGRTVRDYSPDAILYMPQTSITFNSFLRGKILKSIRKSSKVALFATIKRDYSMLQRLVIERFLKPDIVFIFGDFKEWSFNNIRTHILPPAIDTDRFSVPTADEKIQLRERYGVAVNKRVVLHVGHVRPTRNVSLLQTLQGHKDIQVLLIDSTTTPQYKGLIKRMKDEGIIVLSEYIPDMSEIYKLSDIYVFPVRDEIASINLPLSILEAMACGLPVITTRFGGLEGYFQEDEVFRYLDADEELLDIVDDINMDGRANREKVMSFTWDRLVDEMIGHMFEGSLP
ncbi:MAG: hypothetical protein Fur0020_00240 [Thermodesulfovibrionia bacterium]